MLYSLKEALKELNSGDKKVNEDFFETSILNKVKTATFENISLS